MNRIALDASALLAVLNREPGSDKLTPQMLSTAASGTVNLAEVQSKLVSRGLDPDEAWEATLSPIREAVPFTAEPLERLAGSLRRPADWACRWEIAPVSLSDLR
jgi:PIN domain nuclease of toxin-antitoxin system